MNEEQRERQRVAAQEWRVRNPERAKEIQQAYRERNRETMREYNRIKAAAYRNKDPEEYRRKQREWSKRVRIEVLEAYGNSCKCCGENTYEFLSIDHMDNLGALHRQENGRRYAGATLYKLLRQQGFPEGFQVLCHNCNLAKGFYGACPHSYK